MVSVVLTVFSALLSATMAILSTVAVEKLGGVAGGVLSSSPTTILPFSWGLILESTDTSKLYQAMFSVPVALCLSNIYMLMWRELPDAAFLSSLRDRVRLLCVFSLSMTFWLSGAVVIAASLSLLTQSSNNNVIVSIGGVAFVLQAVIAVASLMWRFRRAPAGSNPVTYKTYAMRGVLAGLSIGVSVAIASQSPIAAGVASVFPAITTTAMIALWWSQGSSVSVGATSGIMLGNLSVTTYALLFALWFPLLNLPDVALELVIVAVTCICYVVSVLCCSIPAYMIMAWRINKAESNKPNQQQQQLLEQLQMNQ